MIDFHAKAPIDSIDGLTGLIVTACCTDSRFRVAFYFIEFVHFDIRHDEGVG